MLGMPNIHIVDGGPYQINKLPQVGPISTLSQILLNLEVMLPAVRQHNFYRL